MRYVFVLDFNDGKVYRARLPIQTAEAPMESEDIEEYLDMLGFNLSDCEWMATDEERIYDR